MPTIIKTVDVEVDVELDEFDTQELLTELQQRGADKAVMVVVEQPLQRALPWLRSQPDVPQCLRDLVWEALGKVI